MNKRPGIFVSAALAAGGMLLTACGTGDTASSTSDVLPSTSDSPRPVSGGKDGMEPVYCGEVTLDTGAIHGLIADPAANGIVGCTEGFDVLDEFLKLPQDKRAEASLGNVDLAGGWSCTVDDGVSANISCVKDEVGDDYGFALHTEQQAG